MKTDSERSGLLYDLPIQRKLGTAFGLILLLFAATCALVYSNVSEVRAARDWMFQTYEVLGDFAELRIALQKQQLGERAVVISHDPQAAAPYVAGAEEFDAVWARLKAFTADNRAQQTRLDRIRDAVRLWQRDIALPAMAAARTPATESQAAPLIQSAQNRRLIDEVHRQIDLATSQEQTLLAVRGAELDRRNAQLLATVAVMLGLGLLLGFLAIGSSERLITSPLMRLAGLMSRLAQGDLAIEVQGLDRKDEIGEIARATQVFRKLAVESSDTGWVKSNLAKISARLQTARSHSQFAEILVNELAPLMQAGLALFFAWREELQRLELIGSYGFGDTTRLAPRFALGEGLVGQAAKERRAIVLGGVPDEYARIHSGMGSAAPRALAVLPLTIQDLLLGVIEIGALSRFSDAQQRLLDELMPIAALAFENLSNALRTERLLTETQAQAEKLRASEEELRAQQEELRATNENLRDKSEMLEEQSRALQASEEELRTQSEELRIANSALQERSEQQREQQRELEQAQATLEEKALQLERASQYKSDFLANMSHELRTPLNSMLILSRSLADNDEGNLSGEQVESARIVHDSGNNLLALINDILDLSKVEAGKMEAVAEDLQLADFAGQLERSFRAMAADRKLRFEISVDSRLPARIRTDGARLQQILTNLLSNAFKFTHAGAVRLAIDRPESAPETPGLSAADSVRFRVTDSGIGIPPDKLARIFQAFEQGDTSTSRRYGGTGLGLSICKGLAKLLGGEISVSSTPGSGSVFTLVLPEQMDAPAVAPRPAAVTRPAAVAAVPAAPVAAAAVRPLPTSPPDDGVPSILVIEDDAQFAEVLAGIARGKGYRALIAHEGEQGIALAQAHRPAGILLDIGLPGISGWQVMDQLKREPGTATIPVHFVSGSDDSARAYAAGAAGYLKKPVTKADVNQLIDGLLRQPAEGRRRLLLVDASAADRSRVREMLHAEEVDIDEVNGGEQALERLAQQRYDLLILDLDLPGGMDGIAFLEAASKRGRLPSVLIHSGRELSRDESLKLREYTDAIVMKAAPTTQRLLDEATLFLHSIRRRTPREEPAPAQPAAPPGMSGRTVLIVDDDMRNIFALSKALRARGLKVAMAQDGPKALGQLDNNPAIDLVLMDIMMPGMDGYEAMRQIRARPQWLELPIIAVTAKAMVGDREKCIEAGANDYCSKPIDIDVLVPQIQRLLAAPRAAAAR
ncbi:MAG TPA: response regulator [Solimonas sp.]|nr:response regulator [Solimonas sp.]